MFSGTEGGKIDFGCVRYPDSEGDLLRKGKQLVNDDVDLLLSLAASWERRTDF